MRAIGLIYLGGLLLAFSLRAGAEEIADPVSPPYFTVRIDASTNEEELKIGVTYTIWLPPGVKTLRGIIVHQHGCGVAKAAGEGSEAACDLQWQALARKHGCALLAPAYEQLDSNCRCWCDPRNGSEKSFMQALADLAQQTHHPELRIVPWALWGHSGGASWVGTMFLLHPERVAAVWLRSDAPLNLVDPFPAAAFSVPVMCNVGVREAVTGPPNQFFPRRKIEEFFQEFRQMGALVGMAVDPDSGHDCGNSRYLAIPWFDACLAARLPDEAGSAALKPMPIEDAWLATWPGGKAQPAQGFAGDAKTAAWLPNERIAKAWSEYVKNGDVKDTTPPPSPQDVRIGARGELTWEAEADLESGIDSFVIERDGKVIAHVPESHSGYFSGRPTFQQIGYGDYPTSPLAEMRYVDAAGFAKSVYTVRTVNTVGLQSQPTTEAPATGPDARHHAVLPHPTRLKNLPNPAGPVELPIAVKLAPEFLDAVVGRYEFAVNAVFPNGEKMAISRQGDQLQAQLSVGGKTMGPLAIIPVSETNFFLKIDGSRLTFIKNGKEQATAVIRRFYRNGNPDCIGKRIEN